MATLNYPVDRRSAESADQTYSLEMLLFPEYFETLHFFLCIERTPYVCSLPDGVFLPRDHGLEFRIHSIDCYLELHAFGAVPVRKID